MDPSKIDGVRRAFQGSADIAKAELAKRAAEGHERNKMRGFYPETGPLRRELYPKHMAFFAAGKTKHSRLCVSGNRIGKSEGILCYELTCHATGLYPTWWVGYRFNRPISAWVAGKTSETTRDILQAKLFGKTRRDPDKRGESIGLGTGMIPAHLIISTTPKAGIPDGLDTVWVRHASGGTSQIGLKSYGRDRDSFEGTEKDFIGLDEEPPSDVDDECSMRLMATRPGETGGLKVITFTPLEGYTEVVKKYLESTDPDKWFIQIGWDDAPHISKEEIERMSKQYLPSQLKARRNGEPAMGEGAIYPIDLDELLLDDFKIPDHWPRAFGMDVGKTAVIWGALDRDSDILYFYKEYFSEQYNTILHATAIKGINNENAWIPGVIDPSSLGSSQVDGQKLFNIYTKLGLKLSTADNAVEAGLDAVWTRMITGRLKVFRSLRRWQNEFGRYHRVKRETLTGISSTIVKKDDHCFAGGTRVMTDRGPVAIRGLVGKTGLVLSRSGSWARFYGARKTGEGQRLVRLTFEDGYAVDCTPDHLFLCPSGWKKAQEMAGQSCYDAVSQCIQSQSLFPLLFRSLRAFATTCAVSIFSTISLRRSVNLGQLEFQPARSVYMSASGPSSMGEIPGQSTTFTTSTRIGPITLLETWKRSMSRLTCLFIPTEPSGHSQRQPMPRLSFGTLARQDESGIASTTTETVRPYMKSENSPAFSAAQNTKVARSGRTNSVQTPARPSIALVLALITRNVLAWFAAAVSLRIATFGNSVARESAVLRCLQASELGGPADVYCLTVPGSQAFSLENGAVVHNCQDAGRYLVMSGIAKMKTRPVVQSAASTFGGLSGASGERGWMTIWALVNVLPALAMYGLTHQR